MLRFDFKPLPSDSAASPPTFSGHGRLTLLLNGQDVWSDEESEEPQGVEAYWDSLLHHLAKCWHYLMMEDPYPLDFNPVSPADFLDEAMRELRKRDLSESSFIEEEVKVFAFNARHNLAAGLPEILLPSVFVFREGRDVRVIAESMEACIPIDSVRRTLEELGNAIAQSVHPQSPRGRIILDAWHNRNKPLPMEEAYAMITGISVDNIQLLAANDNLEELFGPPSWDAPSPMLLAARMTQHKLDIGEIRDVMARIADVRLGSLDKKFLQLRGQANTELSRVRDQKHYRQGYHLAQWLRSTLQYHDEQPFEPGRWLQDCGVNIEKTKRVPWEISALACWKNNAAAIVINKNSVHANKDWGEKASLAHEIAHLLVDTEHALPSVDILGGRMPVLVEKRANAFAAELLMPRSQVAKLMPDHLTLNSLERLVRSLMEGFGVGLILAGNHISNLLKDNEKLTPQTGRNIERAIANIRIQG